MSPTIIEQSPTYISVMWFSSHINGKQASVNQVNTEGKSVQAQLFLSQSRVEELQSSAGKSSAFTVAAGALQLFKIWSKHLFSERDTPDLAWLLGSWQVVLKCPSYRQPQGLRGPLLPTLSLHHPVLLLLRFVPNWFRILKEGEVRDEDLPHL